MQAGAIAHAPASSSRTPARAAWHGVFASYHWLDDLGNAIDWDGLRTPLAAARARRANRPPMLEIRAPMPPGPYRLAFDLVLEHRYWLSEIGNEMLEVEVEVVAARRRPRRSPTSRPTSSPRADWHERVRAAHEEGYTAVGGAIESRERELRAYRPGGGRNPAFAEPLVCPSLLPPLEPNCEVAGLPAWRPDGAGSPGSTTAGSARGCGGSSSRRRLAAGRQRSQSSTAIRSSTRLNTHAPSASATTAATQR